MTTEAAAPLVTLDAIRAAAERLRGIAITDPARRLRAARATGASSRPSRSSRSARSSCAGAYVAVASLSAEELRARRHHLLVRQPRPGRGPRRAPAGRPGRRRHAVRCARDQARTGRRRRRRDRHRRHRQRRTPAGRRGDRRGARPGDHPALRRRPDHRRARARSGSRSSRTCRTSPPSSCRSAAAGWPAASRPRSRRSGRSARVIGVEPELAADARDSLERGRDRRAGRPSTCRGRSPTGRGRRRSARGRSPICGRISTSIVTVTEAEIAAGVRLAAERSRLVVEPSGALAIAAMAFHAAELGLAARRPGRGRGQRRERRSRALPGVPRGADPDRRADAAAAP